MAEGCQQPPKVSATSGRKAKPCLLHVSSAPSSFPLWAWSQSQPCGPDHDGGDDFHVHGRVLAASPVGPGPGRQLGAYCSREGGSSLPFTGPRPAATAMSLCRLILSPQSRSAGRGFVSSNQTNSCENHFGTVDSFTLNFDETVKKRLGLCSRSKTSLSSPLSHSAQSPNAMF